MYKVKSDWQFRDSNETYFVRLLQSTTRSQIFEQVVEENAELESGGINNRRVANSGPKVGEHRKCSLNAKSS